MLVGLLALAIITGVTFFGESLDHWFHSLGSSIKSLQN
jgi:Flp pilus assembly pilin Flp